VQDLAQRSGTPPRIVRKGQAWRQEMRRMEALWITSAFVCLMATLASVANAGSAIVLASRRGRWRSAQATVTGHGSRMVSTGPPSYYPATVRYAIARYCDLQGIEHTLEVAEQPAGNTVPILVDPRNPGHACTDEEFQLAAFLIVAAVAAITGLLLALITPPWIHPALLTALGWPG
jgi:hypothetical protein